MKATKRFKTQEREKSSWQRKKVEEKDQKKCFEEEIFDALFESNINQKLYMFMLLSMNDEVSLISSQIVAQIEVVPKVVL